MSNKESFPKNIMEKYQINALGDITEEDFLKIFDEWAAADHDRSKDIILKHYKDNITQTAIGKEYGISRARVCQIITMAGWQLKNRCRQMLKERNDRKED